MLSRHAEKISNLHLRDLLQDEKRAKSLRRLFKGIYLDFSHQLVTSETIELLLDLADAARLSSKIKAMVKGKKINSTENRSVMHVALRASREQEYIVDGKNVTKEVWTVLDKIKTFSASVRSGEYKGVTGKPLTTVISVGIGGSYLGAEYVLEALKTDPAAAARAEGRKLRFIANVDPVGFGRVYKDIDPETTLVVVISKSFGTRETLMNADLVRKLIVKALGKEAVGTHVVAVSANSGKAAKFGIDEKNVFNIWDWVGGRYSVTSAVGILPLSLHYGFETMADFLEGARMMDNHFIEAPQRDNLPILLGLLGVWNSSFLGYNTRALIPYSEALCRLPAHIQQLDMESNGKRVSIDGIPLDFSAGEIDFGEPGTNAQHSFFQLLHQGRVTPVDFIGTVKPQVKYADEELNKAVENNHDELMSNFFAQADALAIGRTEKELTAEGVEANLIPHKVFPGNRPSTSLLLPSLDARAVGILLSLYEHRTMVQGAIWGINSFDQWGVELGKVLGKRIRATMDSVREKKGTVTGYCNSTEEMMKYYLSGIESKDDA